MAKNKEKTKEKKSSPIRGVKWVYVCLSLFLVGLGVCAFVWPGITAGAVCTAIGIAAILFGVVKCVIYFAREVTVIGQNNDFAIGAIAVVGGILLLVFRERVMGVIQLLIGAYLILDSMFKLQTAIDAKRVGIKGWWVSLIFTAACLVFGVVLIADRAGSVIMLIVGVSLILDGLQNLCLVVFSALASRQLEKREREAATAETAIDVTELSQPAYEPTPTEPIAEPAPAEPAAETTNETETTNIDTEGENDPW